MDCPQCSNKMDCVPDGDCICPACGHEVAGWTIGDLYYKRKPGYVWMYCPHCRSSEADGIYANRERRPRQCWVCGGELAVDEERRE